MTSFRANTGQEGIVIARKHVHVRVPLLTRETVQNIVDKPQCHKGIFNQLTSAAGISDEIKTTAGPGWLRRSYNE